MTIRRKIILIVLPLLMTPLLMTVLVSSLSARNGISIIAAEFLRFKNDTVLNYARSQWDLLMNNGFDSDPEFVAAAKEAVSSFAGTIIRSDTELILAVDRTGSPVLATRKIELSPAEQESLAESFAKELEGWRRLRLAGESYVGQAAFFAPFDWYILSTEKEEVFYAALGQIYRRTAIILILSLAAAAALLIVFSNILTRPLNAMVDVIREIISTGDLSKKVSLQYQDETGQLGHYFNLMTGELDKAYSQIKKYAYEMVLAKNRETRIRHIFQKYVPNNVIEQFEEAPESMLKGDNRVMAVLFSDIRSFTTISENMSPDVLVESLNGYFEKMVDVVLAKNGIVDKYIGDAIMAFFGAPVKGDNDALLSVEAGLGMLSSLEVFNRRQRSLGMPPFRIGIGINYGVVTVGNIGSEKKMDYTVIGDMVNLASRLEGLTKIYHEPIIVSESVQQRVASSYPCRLIDRVIVKGKSSAVRIYTVRESLSEKEKEAWEIYHAAMDLYIRRDFAEAGKRFERVLELLPRDYPAKMYRKRSEDFFRNPPPADWQGESVMTSK
ncbi:adenylate/guanylate cyclase domain-containing protein [Marispirochaeta aestuarii]|uniref:Adenylate/guanylate cyclase domain-containing protein n=1 Tax=Marispirochaeta aestuarii TaxID=1963862 RepID=A0A1Y1RZ35_9SPIO|nr:adenylate/guanylate cyclase domain-containing protein [Marispirochaeta aestuarii]ORC35929.1 adenylate/guanylate cyclase domain-containing protein [Marispirochaeta aestuarii]